MSELETRMATREWQMEKVREVRLLKERLLGGRGAPVLDCRLSSIHIAYQCTVYEDRLGGSNGDLDLS